MLKGLSDAIVLSAFIAFAATVAKYKSVLR